jgi:hypothetical protein
MRLKTGQSAIEYLMTYGWMLLVVALVGGLLFTLFQDQELEANSVDGFEGDDIRVEEVTAGNDSVQLSLTSYSSEDMESAEVCLNNDNFDRTCSKEFSLARLGDRVVDLNGFNESERTYTYDVSVSYETTGGISDTVRGSVSLGVESDSSDDSGEESPSETVSLSVRNSGDNVSGVVSPGDSVKIYGEFNSSGSGLDSGWLSTNETGTWENKTGEYFNDGLSGEDVWVWNNFTWSNSFVSSQTVGWKLYANNSDGKVENSSKKSFEVDSGVSAPGVEVLEPVGVNSSNATLRGNVTDLGGAGSVDVSFNVTSNTSIGVKEAGSVPSVGVFSYDLTGLESGTEYNYTARAENSADQVQSSKQNFTSLEGIPDNQIYVHDDWEDGKINNRDDNGTTTTNGKEGIYRPSWNEFNSGVSVENGQLKVTQKSGIDLAYGIPDESIKWNFSFRKPADDNDNGFEVILSSDSSQNRIMFRSGDHKERTVLRDNDADLYIEGQDLADNSKHEIIITRNVSTSPATWKYYIDGGLVGSQQNSIWESGYIGFENNNQYGGKYVDYGQNAPDEPVYIDYLKIKTLE